MLVISPLSTGQINLPLFLLKLFDIAIPSGVKANLAFFNFSSALISDRIDKITALLGVNVDREADIKMQKNSPLSYNAISSIVAELQPADGSPATADISRPDLTPDSAGPHGGTVPSLGAMPDGGVTGGGFGDDPESIGPTGLPGVSVTTY